MNLNAPAGADSPTPSDEPEHTAKAGRLPIWKKTLFLGAIYVGFVVLFEASARVIFFLKDDFSPYYLTYGFVPDVGRHSAEFDGYTKFQPNSVYHYKTGPHRTIEMQINSDGFRGRTGFTRPKPPGTFRIVCLGASSTFGLFDEDDETYPFLLERRLRDALPGRHVEVLNLGIPHFRTNNVLALARNELADLEPDVVTLYHGYNNSMVFRPPEQASLPYRAKDWLKEHSVAYRGVHPFAASAFQEIMKRINKELVPHLDVPVQLAAERVGSLRARLRREYRRDVDALADLVADLNATFVPITQSYTLHNLPNFGIRDRWRTYREEVALVDSILAADETILAPHSTLLIHRDLMEELRAISSERGLPLVEGIDLLDADRENLMASFVHLTPAGNARLAAAIDSVLTRAHTFLPRRTPDGPNSRSAATQ